MRARHIAGWLLILAGAAILVEDWLTGSITLSDFNPLTGLHHEWVGTLALVAGFLLEVVR